MIYKIQHKRSKILIMKLLEVCVSERITSPSHHSSTQEAAAALQKVSSPPSLVPVLAACGQTPAVTEPLFTPSGAINGSPYRPVRAQTQTPLWGRGAAGLAPGQRIPWRGRAGGALAADADCLVWDKPDGFVDFGSGSGQVTCGALCSHWNPVCSCSIRLEVLDWSMWRRSISQRNGDVKSCYTLLKYHSLFLKNTQTSEQNEINTSSHRETCTTEF